MRITSILFIALLAVVSLFLINSCSSKDSGGGPPPNPCSAVNITVSATTTNPSAGSSNGSISASASGGSGFTFSLNQGAFQSTGNFTGLAAGNYSVTAKDSRGCNGTQSFTLAAPDPCTGQTFTVGGSSVSATPCLTSPNGSITITTTGGGSGFTFNINGGAFQSSATFNNLAANTYTVGAKETGGCIKTASVVVAANPSGALFSAVRTIVNSNCTTVGCHSGSTPQGGINFTIDCQIVTNNQRIKVRAVDNHGTGQQMPPPPATGLSLNDRNAIINWINAGGLFSN